MNLLTNTAQSTLPEYSVTKSAIQNLDPRIRILSAASFAICTVALSHLPLLCLSFTLALFLLFLSGLPIKSTLKRMAIMDGFIIFTLLLLPFTMPGPELFHLFGFSASETGLIRAVEIGLTANAVILTLMVLTGSMEPVEIGHALHALKLPEKLIHLLMFTIRYIDVLRDEYLRLRTAMRLRGFQRRSNWHSYRSYGYLIGMMLVRAIDRSERILMAMKCRGFNGKIRLLEEYQLSRNDYLFATSLAMALVGLSYLEVRYAVY